jgi:hypothetical protein
MNTASSGTADGNSLNFYPLGPNQWFAFAIVELEPDPGTTLYVTNYNNGCFYFEAEGTGRGYISNCKPSLGEGYTYNKKTYTLNGVSFPCVSVMQIDPPSPQVPFPPPVFVFT